MQKGVFLFGIMRVLKPQLKPISTKPRVTASLGREPIWSGSRLLYPVQIHPGALQVHQGTCDCLRQDVGWVVRPLDTRQPEVPSRDLALHPQKSRVKVAYAAQPFSGRHRTSSTRVGVAH